MAPDDYTKAMWDKPFLCTFSVTLEDTNLATRMLVENKGEESFDFQAALHSYFTVSAIDNLSITGSFKGKEFLNKINTFPVKPSWVIDTRNGYQCYWILDSNTNSPHKTYWNGIQKKLVNYFEGDARAIKINQIYRIPYTWWRKGWEGKQPYFTSILSGSTGNPVNIEHLKQALDGVSAVVNLIANKTSDEWFKEYARAYKKSDVTGVPVSVNVAAMIANQMRASNPNDYNDTDNIKTVYGYTKGSVFQKAYGDPMPVLPVDQNVLTDAQDTLPDEDVNLDGQQTKLLKTVVEFLNQVSTPLYFSNNRFLSNSAKDLASQISDKFCIG
jgi:hypothetical protein